MAILNLTDSRDAFEFGHGSRLDEIVQRAQQELFGDRGYAVVKGFMEESLADRIRKFYVEDNKDAFRTLKDSKFTFARQNSIIYYLRSPHPKPSFIISAIERISVFRNMVYSSHDYYKGYCRTFGLDPQDFERVFEHQTYHTWSRVSWYGERDGQPHHKDNYGELAAFLFLSRKGIHWKKGGLYAYDDDGNPTADLDQLCGPGDLLLLDQHRILHGVEPIIGANPGRVIIYIPIIPSGYIQRSFVFEGYPWQVYFNGEEVSMMEKLRAFFYTAFRNFTFSVRIHPSRLLHRHRTLLLP